MMDPKFAIALKLLILLLGTTEVSATACNPDKQPESCKELEDEVCIDVLDDKKETLCKIPDVAKLCPHKCKKCCELPQYQCEDKPLDGQKCENICGSTSPVDMEIAKNQCPMTCGLCAPAEPVCKDIGQKCTEYESKHYCTLYKSAMIKECPKTCGYCDELKCEDVDEKACKENIPLCSDKRYEDFLRKNCRKTCGFCNTPTVCIDKNPNCELWNQNGFCEKFSLEEKLEHCAKTCGMC